LDTVLGRMPLHRLAGKLVVDVLSVKVFPRSRLVSQLPPTAGEPCMLVSQEEPPFRAAAGQVCAPRLLHKQGSRATIVL
jgi:hypothetical protein